MLLFFVMVYTVTLVGLVRVIEMSSQGEDVDGQG